MCRLLYIRAQSPFRIEPYLDRFAHISKNSKEYQGDGWGCAYWEPDGWKMYKSIQPIWEDDRSRLADLKSTALVAHARSAFRDAEPNILHNMPFMRGNIVFIFNGELHGVRIREEGRIGAEKIFNYIMRFNKAGLEQALPKAAAIIERRSKYVRAMNIIMADSEKACLHSHFNEDEDYFTMHIKKTAGTIAICSDPFPGESGWKPIPNGSGGCYR